jgi:SAM-dependent methyltransferase
MAGEAAEERPQRDPKAKAGSRISGNGMKLLSDAALERSSVVANSAMNRDRGCAGENSYAKELGFGPVEFLRSRLASRDHVSWLDLCCGAGNAVIEAAALLLGERRQTEIRLVGVDIAGMFRACPPELDCVQLQEASLADWAPNAFFDLITCVHGLHYIGDKLRLIERAVSWLKEDGIFMAHLDPANLKFELGGAGGRQIVRELRRCGVNFDSRRRLLRCKGPRVFHLEFEYLGADDQAGPNFTKQSSVDSYYRRTGPATSLAARTLISSD